MSGFDSSTGREQALRRWAREDDPVAATAHLRTGFIERFRREVDPDGTLEPAEREKRAERAMRAHMIALARRSRIKRAASKLASR